MIEPADPDDPRWRHARHVAGSATFSRSHRLRDLLLFIARAAVDGRADRIDEHEIATVFGRPDATDPGTSGLVRAHMRHLREKLARYYASEGLHDTLRTELPLGTFLPVFRPAAESTPPPPRPIGKAVVAGALVLAALLCAWLGLENRGLRFRVARFGPPPLVERAWRQMFDNGLPTRLVLADANVTLIQDLLGFQLPVADYDRSRLHAMIEERLETSERRVLAAKMLFQRHVPIADIAVSRQVVLLQAAHALPLEVLHARDATPATFENANAILSGPRRANPWVELFESKLNFQSRFEEPTKICSFENRSPLPGEPARYSVVYGVRGYCRVAYLPGLNRAGSVLLLTGTDMTSTEAAADFIGSDRWMRELRKRFGLSGSAPLPHFELLLGTALVTSAVAAPEWVTHRVAAP